ncbi:MAG: S8 family serine peptidase [Thermoleophilaceae bacterium]
MRLLRLLPLALAAMLAVAPHSLAADYAPGEVLVNYEPGAQRAAIQRELGLRGIETLPGGTRRLQADGALPLADVIARLRETPHVEYAVPNHRARVTDFMPNDPGTDGNGLGRWHELQWNFAGEFGINAPSAWELARAADADGGHGVVVAVLDTGVAYSDRGRFVRAPDLYSRRFVRGYDFVDEDRYPNDENGHGTHVTGTIAQRTNNGIGVTGLAYGVKIMPLRVLDFQGAGDASAISRAIRFAARRGADVINMSLEFDAGVRASQIPDIVRAVRYAHSKGSVIVAASGNAGDRAVAYPARASHVISVGAVTIHGCQAEYSNSGRGLDVVAPGGGADAPNKDNPWDTAHCDPSRVGPDIYQQTFTGSSVRSFGLPEGYQGTSMAAPHVSATAALIIATRRLRRSDPSPSAIESRLESTARDLGPAGPDRRYGHGLIDSAAAIDPEIALTSRTRRLR